MHRVQAEQSRWRFDLLKKPAGITVAEGAPPARFLFGLPFRRSHACQHMARGRVTPPDQRRNICRSYHGGHGAAEEPADEPDADADAEPAAAEADGDSTSDAADEGGSSALGWAGLVAGLLGLVAGGLALARTRSTTA